MICSHGPYDYTNLFKLGKLTIPYIVIFGDWRKDTFGFRRDQVDVIINERQFILPKGFEIFRQELEYNETKCSLIDFELKTEKLNIVVEMTSYLDYLMSGEHLDEVIPESNNMTFRDKCYPKVTFHNLRESGLTNICGVGIFILTSDNKVIISERSNKVKVYGNVWSYSASGTMDWSKNINPFDEAAREAAEEIRHTVIIPQSYLFAFGLDAKRLYYQFSICEFSHLTSEEILNRYSAVQSIEFQALKAVDFDPSTIANLVNKSAYEPAAAASLLTLCSARYGMEELSAILAEQNLTLENRKPLIEEWNRRSQRNGVLPVMSTRYSPERLDKESNKFVDAVLSFIGKDIEGVDVLEIGSGIGRLTNRIVEKARSVTCVELSNEMIKKHQRLSNTNMDKIRFVNLFAQDYIPPMFPHEITIVSQVLIHNPIDSVFNRLIEVISNSGHTIFLFEHIDDKNSMKHPFTRLRKKDELLTSLSCFRLAKESSYQLFDDTISFMKLVRQ